MLLVLCRGRLPCDHLHFHSAWQKKLLLLWVGAVRAGLGLSISWYHVVLHNLGSGALAVSHCCVDWLVVGHAGHGWTLGLLMIVLVELVDV